MSHCLLSWRESCLNHKSESTATVVEGVLQEHNVGWVGRIGGEGRPVCTVAHWKGMSFRVNDRVCVNLLGWYTTKNESVALSRLFLRGAATRVMSTKHSTRRTLVSNGHNYRPCAAYRELEWGRTVKKPDRSNKQNTTLMKQNKCNEKEMAIAFLGILFWFLVR